MIKATPFDFPYDGRLVPEHTALLIIDLQEDFLSPTGYFARKGYDPSPLRAILPAVNRLIAAARAAGLTIVHTRQGYRADMADMTPYEKWRRKRSGLDGTDILLRSSPGFQIVADIKVEPRDIVVDKTCNGAFTYTDLELVLRARHHASSVHRLHDRRLRAHHLARSLRPQLPVPDNLRCLRQRRQTGASGRVAHGDGGGRRLRRAR